MKNPFVGAGVALVTPFNADLSIDFVGLRNLVNYQIDNGIDFLVVQGTTGEAPTLSKDEKLKVLQVVQEENRGRLKIIFGVGGNNTSEVGTLLQNLPTDGLDGILSVSPYYNKPTQQGIIAHYKHIASCTSLPIVLYNVPSRTGSNVLASTTLELSKIENIVAMKEASGDFGQIMEPYSISAGLDYPGVGPLHAFLYETNRAIFMNATDQEALTAAYELTKIEGIIPALETAHALAVLPKMNIKKDQVIVINLSGRGDKDLETFIKYLD